MGYLRTREAAAVLNVTPSTLRTWERRFGYPRPQRTPGRHRQYSEAELLVLRDALREGLSISSAVSRARQSLGADTGTLAGALGSFDAGRADAAVEAALDLRSIERAVEDLLLPTLETMARRHGADSAAHAFAARWAAEWLARTRRLMAPTAPRLTVLVADATSGECHSDAPSVRAFELFTARAGARVVSLPVAFERGLATAVAGLRPDAIVVAGRGADSDAVGRWVFTARAGEAERPLGLFRSAMEPTYLSQRREAALPSRPSEAADAIVALATGDRGRIARPAPATGDRQATGSASR